MWCPSDLLFGAELSANLVTFAALTFPLPLPLDLLPPVGAAARGRQQQGGEQAQGQEQLHARHYG